MWPGSVLTSTKVHPSKEGKSLPSPHSPPCLAPLLGIIMAATSSAQLISVKPFGCFMWEANSRICCWIAVRSLPASPPGCLYPGHTGSAGEGCRGAAQCLRPQGSDRGKHMARKQQEETSPDNLLRTRSGNHLHTSPSGTSPAKRHPARAFPTPLHQHEEGDLLPFLSIFACSAAAPSSHRPQLPPPSPGHTAVCRIGLFEAGCYFWARLIEARLSTLHSGGKAKGLFFRRSQLPEAQLLPVSLARYTCWRATVGDSACREGRAAATSAPLSVQTSTCLPDWHDSCVTPTPGGQVTISAATPMQTAGRFGGGTERPLAAAPSAPVLSSRRQRVLCTQRNPEPQQQQRFALHLRGVVWFIRTESGIPGLFPQMKINFKCW